MPFDPKDLPDEAITFLYRQRHYLLIKRIGLDYETQSEFDEIDQKITFIDELISKRKSDRFKKSQTEVEVVEFSNGNTISFVGSADSKFVGTNPVVYHEKNDNLPDKFIKPEIVSGTVEVGEIRVTIGDRVETDPIEDLPPDTGPFKVFRKPC